VSVAPAASTPPLALEGVPCPLCGGAEIRRLATLGDVALGVPGEFTLARCLGCGLVQQNPRVRRADLARAYPATYRAHTRDAEIPRILARHGRAVRWALAAWLGYRHLDTRDAAPRDRLLAALLRRKIATAFPRWLGDGRLLDVGCASGKFLAQMGAVGWRLAGVELDPEAAATARTVTPDVFVGDPLDAPFAAGAFDLVTAFHVLEHLPEPRETLRAMLRWTAPGGLVIVEVPNVAGVGARLFGRYWSGLDFPRHLVHFTPATMRAMVERAGGRVVRETHRTKPRYWTRSLRHLLRDRRGAAAGAALAALEHPVGRGALKAALEALMPLGRALRRGEAVRYVIRRAEAPGP
jgi:SAM-dependent methyltransferase